MILDDRSERNLMGVHEALVKVVRKSFEDWNRDGNSFIVTEGLRSKERQQALFRAGASWTLNSRHLTGHAVDLACKLAGEVRWDWPLYERLGEVMKGNAQILKVAMVWGGDWKVRDGPHYELDRAVFP